MRFVFLLVMIIAQANADKDSYNRGEMLFFASSCSSCHGPAAEGSTAYPRLANKKEEYLKKKLIDFRSGKAITVSQQMMAQFTKKLSDENINDLCFFLSTHKHVDIEDVDDDVLGGFGS